jgi:hypothetical protein
MTSESKRSPRGLAGMIRSFNYAAISKLRVAQLDQRMSSSYDPGRVLGSLGIGGILEGISLYHG